MIADIIRDSPVLAGAIAILVAIFLFLIIAIMTAHRKPREEELPRRRNGRRDPDFDGDSFDFDEFDRDYGPRRDVAEPRSERRAGRYGSGALAVSFLLGLAVGLAGLAAGPHLKVGSILTALLGLVDAGPSTAREQATGEGAPPASAAADAPKPRQAPKRQRMREVAAPEPAKEPAVASADTAERDARLVKFVDRLKGELPKPVGPMTVLASVERSGDSVTLGYHISRVPNDSEVSEIQAALRNGVVDTFCKGKSDEARFLNDNGIEFRLIYTDKDGRTIAQVTAEPKFCSKAG